MAKKKYEYGCQACGKKPKSRPYGAKRGKYWCSGCDRDLASEVSKGAERQRAKKEIDENY